MAASCRLFFNIRRSDTLNLVLNSKVPVFMSGIVLLLNIWSRKLNSLSMDPAKEMVDVHRCMQILKRCESRYVEVERLSSWTIEHNF